MAYTLQQLSDLEDIRTLKHRYFRGIDTADMALLAGVFTDDVTVAYHGGTYDVVVDGRAEMLEFIANSFHAQAVSMHQGHMPEIVLTGPDSAEGTWYLEDLFIDLAKQEHTIGSAIYTDRYRREQDGWKIAASEYERVIEVVRPLAPDIRVTEHRLGKTGRPFDQVTDVSHLIRWF
ncbi:MAG: nuclear transport factor 2 family protein [Novosphingobium sp.]|nr:nuclear transport factor 2 family protein [Novosphingobium sp.]